MAGGKNIAFSTQWIHWSEAFRLLEGEDTGRGIVWVEQRSKGY